jgi:hypothetical protein
MNAAIAELVPGRSQGPEEHLIAHDSSSRAMLKVVSGALAIRAGVGNTS